jgi:hypothetical protein
LFDIVGSLIEKLMWVECKEERRSCAEKKARKDMVGICHGLDG